MLEWKGQGEGHRSFRQERLDGTLLRTIRVNRAFEEWEEWEDWDWTKVTLRETCYLLEDLEASRYTTRSVTNVEG